MVVATGIIRDKVVFISILIDAGAIVLDLGSLNLHCPLNHLHLLYSKSLAGTTVSKIIYIYIFLAV